MTIDHFDSTEEFDELLKKSEEEPIVVYFSGENCGPCQRAGPVYEKLSDEYKIKFFKTERPRRDGYIDVFRNQAPHIQAYPTFFLFYYGVSYGKIVGASNEEILSEWLDVLLKLIGKSKELGRNSPEKAEKAE